MHLFTYFQYQQWNTYTQQYYYAAAGGVVQWLGR